MTAYVVAQMHVTNPEIYEEYKKLSGPAVAAYGGIFLTRGGAMSFLEGENDAERTVIIAFPDAAAARAWYDSPQYRAARALREGASHGVYTLVEAQPG